MIFLKPFITPRHDRHVIWPKSMAHMRHLQGHLRRKASCVQTCGTTPLQTVGIINNYDLILSNTDYVTRYCVLFNRRPPRQASWVTRSALSQSHPTCTPAAS